MYLAKCRKYAGSVQQTAFMIQDVVGSYSLARPSGRKEDKESKPMILEEFDQSQAIINPEDLNESIEGISICRSLLLPERLARMLADFEHELITATSMANIEILSIVFSQMDGNWP